MLGVNMVGSEYRNPAPEGRHIIARWRQPLGSGPNKNTVQAPDGAIPSVWRVDGHSHRYLSLYSRSCFSRNEMNSSLKVIVV